jgi:hypothetical protein
VVAEANLVSSAGLSLLQATSVSAVQKAMVIRFINKSFGEAIKGFYDFKQCEKICHNAFLGLPVNHS